jgi:hypothetical protein
MSGLPVATAMAATTLKAVFPAPVLAVSVYREADLMIPSKV